MKYQITILAVVGALLIGSSMARAAKPATEEAKPETKEQRDARMKWWREAKFGMFIHWGVYSVPAGTYDGKQIGGIGEWIMCNGKIPLARYAEYPKEFNPVKFNAKEWVKIAKNAGQKYIVITAKHHDGFAMFCSKASSYNICDDTPFHRDPLKELAAACRKEGIRLGFYYSQAQDWGHPGGAACSGHWDKAQDGSMDEYIDKVAVPQVRELLTNYGSNVPAVLWWDTPCGMNQERAAKLHALLALKPGIIANNRLGGGFAGDTETPEQHIPATGFKGRDWETCMTMNDTWGYKSYDHNWKSTQTLLRNLIDIVSKGGNYLLNVGPTAEGLIPAESIERLKEVGAWMKVNSEAIYKTTASPFAKLPFNGRCTAKPGKLYFHVFDWPKDGKLIVPVSNRVKKAYLLAAPDQVLSTTSSDEGVVVSIPMEMPDKIASVVVVEYAGELEVITMQSQQAGDGSFSLNADRANLNGGLQIESLAGGAPNIGYWVDAKDSVEWRIKCAQPGKFNVEAELACPAASAGSEIVLQVGKSSVTAKVPATDGWDNFQKVTLGQIEVEQGSGKVVLKVNNKPGQAVMNLRCIRLIPVK